MKYKELIKEAKQELRDELESQAIDAIKGKLIEIERQKSVVASEKANLKRLKKELKELGEMPIASYTEWTKAVDNSPYIAGSNISSGHMVYVK